jgi:hypothetical protein
MLINLIEEENDAMKKQAKSKQKSEDSAVTLGDMINLNLVKQLKETQQQLKAEETRKKEEEEQKKREERRLREKNKSFEELLKESNLNWREYK